MLHLPWTRKIKKYTNRCRAFPLGVEDPTALAGLSRGWAKFTASNITTTTTIVADNGANVQNVHLVSTTGTGYSGISFFYPGIPGKIYKITIDLKTSGNCKVDIRAEFYDAASGYLGNGGNIGSAAYADWTTVTKTAGNVSPANTALMSLAIRCTPNAAGNTGDIYARNAILIIGA